MLFYFPERVRSIEGGYRQFGDADDNDAHDDDDDKRQKRRRREGSELRLAAAAAVANSKDGAGDRMVRF